MKSSLTVFAKLFLVGSFLMSVSAFAEGKKACKADMEKFCANVERGEGRIAKCMKEHKDELSPACKEQIEHMREKIKEVKAACQDDMAKLCPGKKAKEMRSCMKEHKEQLSEGCKAEFKNRRN